MEIQQKHEIASALESYLEGIKLKGDKKASQALVAKNIGISPSYITHIKNREFDLKNRSGSIVLSDYILNQVTGFLGLTDFNWNNKSHEACLQALMDAKMHSKHNIIDGPTGTSKTYTCRHMLKKLPVNTYVVTCASDMSSKQFMIELAKEVGLKKTTGSRYELRRAIGDKLIRLKCPHLIIQEAELLPDSSFAAIKDLYDYQDLFKKVGISLVGAELIDLLDSKCQRKHPKFFPQFISRFSLQVLLDTPSKSEKRDIANFYPLSKEEVDRVVAQSDDLRQLDDNIKEILNDRKLNDKNGLA